MNKKIKNAKKQFYNGIQFKSDLEVMGYKTLVENGFNPQYEKKTFILSDKLKPSLPFYARTKKLPFRLNVRTIDSITYTPDFTFNYKGLFVIVEMKGRANDVYPYKRNLFRKLMDKEKNTIFFEIYTKKELLKAIEIIKNYESE